MKVLYETQDSISTGLEKSDFTSSLFAIHREVSDDVPMALATATFSAPPGSSGGAP